MQSQSSVADYPTLAQELLEAVRAGDSVKGLQHTLARAEPTALAADLGTEEQRLAFWLNLYNAFTQVALHEDSTAYRNRSRFFGKKSFAVAGQWLSLNDIEHGLLRRSQVWWGLGYVKKLFPGRYERQFRLERRDFRIHFALNCGARSCPPIAFYEASKIDQQLDLATAAYLHSECGYDSSRNTVEVPKLFSWFRGDFGGKRGIYRLLEKENIIPAGTRPKLVYKEYDWTLALGQYRQ